MRLFLVFMSLFIFGCGDYRSNRIDRELQYVFDEDSTMTYFKDDRTQLCFAFLYGGFSETSYAGLATVSCEAVKKLHHDERK